jgi:hypothetical protein
MIEKVVKILRNTSEKSDFKYWQSQPYQKRLLTLEEIREEYNSWRYDHQQGFQRVFRNIKHYIHC